MSITTIDHVPTELTVVPLERVLDEVRPLVERVAERKRITVTFQLAPSLPTAAGNELPVMRLCYLLIVRAISVTPPYGEVRVSARVVRGGATPTAKGGVQLSVWDGGPGITAADFERVFQDFEPVEVMRAEGCSGMTIGCGLLHLPGARLTMKADWDRGCTFTVMLPDSVSDLRHSASVVEA